MAILSEIEDSDINDVYQFDICHMEQMVMSRAGIAPFLREGLEEETSGFFVFEMYTNIKWRPKQ